MASEIRNRFTDTEMQIARETDLPELLSHLGYAKLQEQLQKRHIDYQVAHFYENLVDDFRI